MDQMMVTQLMECGKMGEGRWGKAEMLKAENGNGGAWGQARGAGEPSGQQYVSTDR